MAPASGHHVGGVTIDLAGNVYVADFGSTVWRISPEGEAEVLADGFYGASGNAIDRRGNLIQSDFYANTVNRVTRQGVVTELITEGLNGPVGVALHPARGDIYVANCRANTVARFGADGAPLEVIESALFNCPNGLAFDRSGALYVVNFSDNRMLRINPNEPAALFATVSDAGLGHLYFKRDRFFVTAFSSHRIYEVSAQGEVRLIAGAGERGSTAGPGQAARLSYPNGVAISPDGSRLYFNEFLQPNISDVPRRAQVRRLQLRWP
jgi:sugar lactone lactonase YvrE